jgi:hypothetical protein
MTNLTRHALCLLALAALGLCPAVGLSKNASAPAGSASSAAPSGSPDASQPSAQPEPTDPASQASAAFRRGVDFYTDGDYRAALIEFQRAYEIAPNYAVLYNLGQTFAELKDYAGALRAFEQYLTDGGDAIEAERSAKVKADIEKLRLRVAKLTVAIGVANAEILVDGVPAGRSPLAAPLLVSAGRRKISVSKPGYLPLERYVDVGGGEAKRLELELSPVAAATPGGTKIGTRGPATEPPPAEGGTNVGAWVSLGTTVALAAATGVLGGLALSANGDYQDTLDTFPTTPSDVDDARKKVRTYAIATDVLGALAAGAGIVTILFATLAGGDDAESGEAAASEAEVSRPSKPHLVLGAGVGSIELHGRF